MNKEAIVTSAFHVHRSELSLSCRLRDTGQRGRINNMKAPLGKGIFLIAAPSLRDPNFRQTVVLLCEHGAEGALGVVVNHPTAMSRRPYLKCQFSKANGTSSLPEGLCKRTRS